MKEPEVRRLKPEDMESVFKLLKIYNEDTRAFININKEAEEIYDEINATIETRFFYGVFLGNRCIGICNIGSDNEQMNSNYRADADTGILSEVYIAPDVRKCGYGKLLIMEAIRQCKYSIICTDYYFMDIRLKKFYQKLGFECTDKYGIYKKEQEL